MSNKKQKKLLKKAVMLHDQEYETSFQKITEAFNTIQNSASIEEAIDKTNLAHEHTSQIVSSDFNDLSHAKRTVQKEYNILTAIKGINPEDSVEAMLAAQMVAVHNAGMKALYRSESYSRSRDVAMKKLSQASLSLANKSFRTYAMQMETLNKYRGKGQQKITVEYLNINDGGKAVIANIPNKKKH